MSALYSVSINNLNTMQYDLDTIQYLTNMFFRGVVDGDVIVCTTAQGSRLLFTNPESATYVELDTGLQAEYVDSVSYITKRLSWDSMKSDPSKPFTSGSSIYDATIRPASLTNHTTLYNAGSNGIANFNSTP